MATIVLFHSILGLRDVERQLAHRWEADGHEVRLPDLYGGQTAETYDDGFVLKDEIGDRAITERAWMAVNALPAGSVLAGVSFGAYLIGDLRQRRSDFKGAVLLSGIAPWMEPRAAGFPVTALIARPDPFDDEDVFADWAASAGAVDLDLRRYDGVGHLFLDETLSDYDLNAAVLCFDQTLRFLRDL